MWSVVLQQRCQSNAMGKETCFINNTGTTGYLYGVNCVSIPNLHPTQILSRNN